MELLNFLNEHKDDWEDILKYPPYNIAVRRDGDYVLFKYDQVMSDFSLSICREARGSIFRFTDSDKWRCVCFAFEKFFNYSEAYADTENIDWQNCHVLQKVDGSLCKIWCDLGQWHVSTNGAIDAWKADFKDGVTYGDLIVSACGGNITNLTTDLDPTYCYYFELTGPNRIVINYGDTPQLWFLGRRSMINYREDYVVPNFTKVDVLLPHRFVGLRALNMCVNLTEFMTADEEGYVVVSQDKNGKMHRIKIKGKEYLRLHAIRGNGALTANRVITMWQQSKLDDYQAVFPENNKYIEDVFSAVKKLAARLDKDYVDLVSGGGTRKQLAIKVKKTCLPPSDSYIFAQLDDKVQNSTDFIKNMPSKRIISYIESDLKSQTYGVQEDE